MRKKDIEKLEIEAAREKDPEARERLQQLLTSKKAERQASQDAWEKRPPGSTLGDKFFNEFFKGPAWLWSLPLVIVLILYILFFVWHAWLK